MSRSNWSCTKQAVSTIALSIPLLVSGHGLTTARDDTLQDATRTTVHALFVLHFTGQHHFGCVVHLCLCPGIVRLLYLLPLSCRSAGSHSAPAFSNVGRAWAS
ncbi:hypothetical protein BGY98DRAFT_1009404 [Russula aff. rugulosa BPL654]|nr:hypothetical protein BGY98DRAFT_1009404 [Russula aff. rugulosa BPL654]